MEFNSKYNDKKHSCIATIKFDDYTDLIEKSVLDNVRTTIAQHNIINQILEIFIQIAASGRGHVDSYTKTFDETIHEYRIEFFFGKFMETVIISWNQNVSLIEIKTYSFSQKWHIGHIGIIVNPDRSPKIENLMGEEGSNLSKILFKHLKRDLCLHKPNIQ